MVSFRESPVDEPGAHALLEEYFTSRELGFTGAHPYHVAFPQADDFVPPQGVFLVVEDEVLQRNPAARTELVIESGELVVEAVDPAHQDDSADSASASDSSSADVGCGGIRRLPAGESGGIRYEVKHLWLQPSVRGRGLSRLLMTELENRAVAFGATELVLDTNSSLEAAAALYRSSGFVGIEAYNDNPNATNWYRKSL